MYIFLLIALCALLAIVFIRIYFYKKSSYYQVTKNSFFKVRTDTGLYGEFLTYQYLKYFEYSNAKFFFYFFYRCG